MTGLAKTVLIGPGRLEQGPAGSQDRREWEHWAEGGRIPAGSRGEERGDRALPSNPEGKSHLD